MVRCVELADEDPPGGTDVGLALLLIAVPFLVFAPGSQPVSGIVLRRFVSLERRLEFFRSLSPRLARHLLPSHENSRGDG